MGFAYKLFDDIQGPCYNGELKILMKLLCKVINSCTRIQHNRFLGKDHGGCPMGDGGLFFPVEQSLALEKIVIGIGFMIEKIGVKNSSPMVKLYNVLLSKNFKISPDSHGRNLKQLRKGLNTQHIVGFEE
jgi:hypothetical protein